MRVFLFLNFKTYIAIGEEILAKVSLNGFETDSSRDIATINGHIIEATMPDLSDFPSFASEEHNEYKPNGIEKKHTSGFRSGKFFHDQDIEQEFQNNAYNSCS